MSVVYEALLNFSTTLSKEGFTGDLSIELPESAYNNIMYDLLQKQPLQTTDNFERGIKLYTASGIYMIYKHGENNYIA